VISISDDIAIRVKGLGKKYQIGGPQEKYLTMRDAIVNSVKAPFHRIFNRNSDRSANEFWALRDVSFDVNKGEVIGVIGKNGAGKSTLLKILSRITTPTEGTVELHGRVGSLLEVGTGFHPEMTGRENIFLNGSILGMKKTEIEQKFDEIVEFAEIEKFLDTPVKRYSSGMYVRLAFAVAAHLEPEILVVDEVLAVGDVAFQKKCLGKMGDVAKEGRTVLFVSHNMSAVQKLCDSSIILENGYKTFQGKTNDAVDHYLYQSEEKVNFKPFQIKELDLLIKKITLNEENNGIITPCKPLKIDIEMEAEYDINTIGLEILISHDDTSGVVFRTNTKTIKNMDIKIKRGENKISCLVDSFNLCSGRYWLGFGVSLLLIKYYYYELALLRFDVSEEIIAPSCLPTLSVYSHVYLDHEWIIQD
jgi:lipopolysaccharide transport system ATP-binding protein